ncbi:hypothetical protein [Streptomyces termitum]|uniref:hypothetical protein n=1 Tax=Streptomyces termitum TaxID=67368 RepID=UPI0033A8CB0F
MQRKRGAAAALAALTVFGVAGCGGGAEVRSTAGLDRKAVHEEILGIVAASGLPESGLPGPGEATPSATPTAPRERLLAKATGCAAGWQYTGPVVAGSRAGFDKALTALAGAEWKESGQRIEETSDEVGTVVGATFKKEGWTLYARHTSPKALKMDAISLNATEDACMAQFSEQDLETMYGEDAVGP